MQAQQMRRVRRLWQRSNAIAPAEVEPGWRDLVREVADLLDAPGGGFGVLYSRRGGPKDPFAGWLPVRALEEGEDSERRMQIKAEWIGHPECQHGESVARMFADSGTLRVMRTRDIEPDPTRWLNSPSRQLIEKHGYRDRIIGA